MAKFCIHCGKALPDNALFCSGCGAKVDCSADVSNAFEQTDTSEHVIQGLQECKTIFSPMQSKYDARNKLQISLNTKNNFFLLFVIFIAIGFFLGNALDYTFWEMGIQGLGVMSCWFGIGIGIPLFLTMRIKKTDRNNAVLLNQINAELESNYRSKQLPIKLAFEYTDPRIIDVLTHILQKGRADSLKEAINCMLDDQYKAESLKAQKEIKNSADAQSLLALGIFLRMNKK